jgi:hypothetical protein
MKTKRIIAVAAIAILAACSGGSAGGASSDPMVQRAQVAINAFDMCDHVSTVWGLLDSPGYVKAGLLKASGNYTYAPTPLLIKIATKTDATEYKVCPVHLIADSVKTSTAKGNDDTDVVFNTHLEWQPWAKDPAFQHALMPVYMTVNGYTEALQMAPATHIEEAYDSAKGWGCTLDSNMVPTPCGTASP